MNKHFFDEMWRWYLTGRAEPDFLDKFESMSRRERAFKHLFPGRPRCFECDVPLSGLGAWLLRWMGSRVSTFSPRLCGGCETAARKAESGAEVELSMIFADVRGSTPLAESTPHAVFKDTIKRFYKATTDVLVEHNAMVNRLMGDQVSALFVERFAGKLHARAAFHAARQLLLATGHGDPHGAWVPVGVGVHTGSAFVGVVGSASGVNEIAVLGSAANLCARLSSQAAAGEVLISEEAVRSGGLDVTGLEQRTLQLKGIDQPVSVRVWKAAQAQPEAAPIPA